MVLIQSSYERASGPIAMGLLDFCNVGIDGSAERGLGDTIAVRFQAHAQQATYLQFIVHHQRERFQ